MSQCVCVCVCVREGGREREDVRALAAREEVCLHLRVSEGEEDSE